MAARVSFMARASAPRVSSIAISVTRGSGAWFTFEEAKAFSETHLAEIHKARQSKKIKVRDEPPAQPLTIEDLLNDWFNSREVQSLAPASISSYAKAMRAVLYRR